VPGSRSRGALSERVASRVALSPSAYGVLMPERSRDPDYRFTLANERTLLAWLRTALALLAAGVAVVQLAPEFGIAGARHVVGIVLAALGVAVAAAAVLRWRRVQRAIERDEDLPPTRMPLLLGMALAVLGIAVGVILAITAVS
jgi:putative membrane protein